MTEIEHNGCKYQYDADFDVFRPVPEAHELTHISKFGWIYFVAVVTVICYFTIP
jgi:hypothetical protein